MRGGLVLYSFGLMMAVALVESAIHPAWRALAFIPFMGGSLFMFQAAYGICPMRAARGERETEIGVEKVANPEQRAHDKKRATTVFSTAVFFAVLTTVVLFLVP